MHRCGGRLGKRLIPHGLVDGQAAASTGNQFEGGTGLHKLEAVAEGAPLLHDGVKFGVAERQGELEANDFADRDFDHEHGGNSRFADVDCVPSNDRAVARVHTNVHFHLEPGMAARVHGVASLPAVE